MQHEDVNIGCGHASTSKSVISELCSNLGQKANWPNYRFQKLKIILPVSPMSVTTALKGEPPSTTQW